MVLISDPSFKDCLILRTLSYYNHNKLKMYLPHPFFNSKHFFAFQTPAIAVQLQKLYDSAQKPTLIIFFIGTDQCVSLLGGIFATSIHLHSLPERFTSFRPPLWWSMKIGKIYYSKRNVISLLFHSGFESKRNVKI